MFYFRERLEARLGYLATKITYPVISVLLLLGMAAAFLPPVNDILNTVIAGYLAILVVFGSILMIMFEPTPERTIVIYCYIIMASIIFIGVIQRFVFSVQVPWSTTIPPLLLMIMVWFGPTFQRATACHVSMIDATYLKAHPLPGRVLRSNAPRGRAHQSRHEHEVARCN